MWQTRKSSLFLLELIVSLLFFVLSVAVCVQLFAKAHLLRVQSEQRNTALLYAQTAAELYREQQADVQAVITQTQAQPIALPEAEQAYQYAICVPEVTAKTTNQTATVADYAQTENQTAQIADMDACYRVQFFVSNDALPTFTVLVVPPHAEQALVTLSTQWYHPSMATTNTKGGDTA